MKTCLTIALFALAAPALAQAPAAQGPLHPTTRHVVRGPSLALSVEAAEAAMAACRAKGYPIGVAVVDDEGGLRLVMTDDGAWSEGPNGSRRKAILSGVSHRSGAEITAQIGKDKPLADQVAANHDWLARPGSLVLKAGDKVVGAIAVEGEPHDLDKDVACAQAGVDKIQSRLK